MDSQHSKTAAARWILAITTVASSWLLMQAIHESGHVLGAFLTGAHVRRVVLVPWELSRTDLLQNPHPLFVCWAGPMFGAFGPVVAWQISARFKWSVTFWLRFLAGFCLIANGAYIGVGAFTRDGDGGDLLRDGSSAWTLWLFGIITIPWGLRLWHGLGADFGIGRNAQPVPARTVAVSLFLLAIIIVAESIFANL